MTEDFWADAYLHWLTGPSIIRQVDLIPESGSQRHYLHVDFAAARMLLGVRARKVFIRLEVTSWNAVPKLTGAILSKQYNCGATTVAEIRRWADSFGLPFPK